MAIVRESSGYTPYGGSGVEGGIAINIPAASTFFICVQQQQQNPATGTLTLNSTGLNVRGDVAFYYNGNSSRVYYVINPPTGASVTLTGSRSYPVAWAAYSGVDLDTPFDGTDETLSQDETTPLFSDDAISSSATDIILQLISFVPGGDPGPFVGRHSETIIGGMVADPYFFGAAIAELPGTGGEVTIGGEISSPVQPFWSFGARTVRLKAAAGGGGGGGPVGNGVIRLNQGIRGNQMRAGGPRNSLRIN